METYMIKELKESNLIIDKIIKLEDKIFLNIIKDFKDKKIILTGMGSSYFISEIGNYFFRNILLNDNFFSCSADEIENFFPFLSDNYFIITCSQSGNTKEISNLLKELKNKKINNLSFTNNVKGEHINLSNNNFFLDIGLEKSPVSTKYVIYMTLFFYKFSLLVGNIKNKDKYLSDIKLLQIFSEKVFIKYNNILDKLVEKYNSGDNFIVIGNGLNYLIAKEISLKIRETIGVISSYDNIGQLNHGGINSINKKTICILLEDDKEIYNKIKERGGKIISIGKNNQSDINYIGINKYINSVQKIILLQYFIHKLACKLNIDTDKKMW